MEENKVETSPVSNGQLALGKIPTRFARSLIQITQWTTYANGKRGVVTIPRDLDAIDQIICIIEEIENAHQVDVANASILRDANVGSSAFSRLKNREIWRIGSYIVFLTNLNGVIKESYRQTAQLLHVLLGGGTRYDLRSDTEVQARADELANVTTLRNKVFAHTAFGSPRPEDTASDRATSLAMLGGSGISWSAAGFRIGSAQVIVGGAPTVFKGVSFVELAGIVRPFLDAWWSMYRRLTDRLAEIDDETWERVLRQTAGLVDNSGLRNPVYSVRVDRHTAQDAGRGIDNIGGTCGGRGDRQGHGNG